MIKSITITNKEFINRLHFTNCEFKRFNILFGGNGSGKSSLFRCIKDTLVGKTIFNDSLATLEFNVDDEHMLHTFYNAKDNFRHNNPNPMIEDGYTESLVQRVNAANVSEGQSIIYTFSHKFDAILTAIEDNKDKQHVILFDELDSGLSCDHVNVVMHMISMLLEHNNVQIFVATNMYHWVHVHKEVLSMYTGEFIKINSYEDYFRIQMDNNNAVGQKSDFNFL